MLQVFGYIIIGFVIVCLLMDAVDFSFKMTEYFNKQKEYDKKFGKK
jgi:hypothetical protein